MAPSSPADPLLVAPDDAVAVGAREERVFALGSLAAGLAHEINAPLATVLTNLDVVLERLGELEVPTDRVRPLVEALIEARAGVDLAASNVQTLRSLGAVSTGAKRADVGEAARIAVAMAGHAIRHRARLRVEDIGAPLVRAHLADVAEILALALLEVVRDLPDGGAGAHEIHLVADTGPDGWARVAVSHEGGLVMVPTPPGAAMAECRALLLQIGGSLTVAPPTAHSRDICIRLPAALGDRPTEPAARRGGGPVGRRGRVLVADDDPMVRRALTRALERLHEVVAVESGRDALALVRARKDPGWDAIVCDLMMPDITGRQLHSMLAQESPDLARRMIFVTGGAFTTEYQDFVDEIDNPVLDKPFRIGALRQLIAAAVALADS